jgi:hypothetical protein
VLNFAQNEKIKYKKEYSVTVFHFFYKRMLQNFEGKKKEIFWPKFGLCFQFGIILKLAFKKLFRKVLKPCRHFNTKSLLGC